MKKMLIVLLALTFLLSGAMAQDKCCGKCKQKAGQHKCKCQGKDKCKCKGECLKCLKAQGAKLVKMWQALAAKKMPPEHRKQAQDLMATLTTAPCFKAAKATKLLMKKACYANWYLYQLCKENCPGCKKAKKCGECKQCAAWMAKLPEKVRHMIMARYNVVMTMANVGKQIEAAIKKMGTCPYNKEAFKCEAKDMVAMKAIFEKLTQETAEVTKMWQAVPAAHKALSAEKRKALEAARQKWMQCELFQVNKKTAEYFCKMVERLAKIDAFCAQKCPARSKEQQAKPISQAFAASSAMNLKIASMLQVIQKVKAQMSK